MTGSIGLLGNANWGVIMGSATTVLRVADAVERSGDWQTFR